MILEQKQSETSNEFEARLLKKVAEKGDREAMQVFYREYRLRLAGFLYRLLHNKALVEEVFNDVMLIVWQKASQFNGSSKVSTWVFSIAYRHGLQRLRKESKHSTTDIEVEQLETNELLVNDNQDVICKALSQLSFEHRTVVELTYYMGYNYAEVAAITECPESTVKTRMYYARRRLQHELAKVGITSVVS